MRRQLIVMLRYPEAGKAKTRLIPKLGAEGAAALARELAERALDVADVAAAEESIDIFVWYTGCDEARARAICPGDFSFREQSGADLGSRMNAAFEAAFANGYDQVTLIGTDCPELDEDLVHEAFDALAVADVVIGPATDGGYYLIALRAPAPELFKDIIWGTGEVLEATVKTAHSLGLSVEALPLLWDVDRPDDLIDYELYKTREASTT